VFDG
jgi:hypothetical protein